jgi:NADPH:quinone reductase-like Zn-dependent oxidoreductase
VGLAATAIAKNLCAYIAVTTRKAERESMLKANGANAVFIDSGEIGDEVLRRHPEKFSKILELVGVTTLADSMKCAQDNGIVCVTGIAGGKWVMENFYPNAVIPTSVCLTTFSSSTEGFMNTPLEESK